MGATPRPGRRSDAGDAGDAAERVHTATPVEIPIVHGDHSLIGLGASAEDALEMVKRNLAGKTRQEIFPAKE